jgi:hypothetical protein
MHYANVPPRVSEPETPAPRRTAAPPVHAVLAAQSGHGNAWVTRALARLRDEAQEQFRAGGLMPGPDGLDYEPPTGLGGFNACYDPLNGRLDITLRIGFDFTPSLRIDGAGVVTEETPDFAADAADVTARFPDPAQRAVEVNTNWRWNGGEAAWMQQFAHIVSDAWGEEHWFVSERWPDQYAVVNVIVDAHFGAFPDDHCVASVAKVPPGSTSGPKASVDPDAGPIDVATFTSATLGATGDWKNYRLEFLEGSADVLSTISTGERKNGENGDVLLDMLMADLQPAAPGGGETITLYGRASTTGTPEDNLALSRRRAESVKAYLQTSPRAGIPGLDPGRIRIVAEGDRGAGADQTWQRVDIQIGDGEAQRTITHEAGHMFGLDDEYASPPLGTSPGTGSGGQIGGTPLHGKAPLTGRGIPPARFQNDDGIMSIGNVVEPQHYVTFLDALNRVTAPEAFRYGGAGPAPPP